MLYHFDYNLIANSKNLWYNYFRLDMDIDLESSINLNNFYYSISQINSISFFCFLPVYIDIHTTESYDTQFYGTNCYDYNCFMYLYDDIHNVEDDDYCDLNACVAVSVTDKISFFFQPSIVINQPYKLFHIEVRDYLFNY